MATAKGALSVTLEAFLDDQLRETDDDEYWRRCRTKFWWLLVSFAVAIFFVFGATHLTLK